MLQTPPEVAARFDAAMLATGVAEHHRPHFCRWLRFYLDFCDKYRSGPADAASLRAFEEKLRSKGQAPWQRQQAHQAVVLYWLLRTEGTTEKGAKATPAVAASVTRSALASAPAGEAVDVPDHTCRRSTRAASAPHDQAAGRAVSARQLVSGMEATSEREHPAPLQSQAQKLSRTHGHPVLSAQRAPRSQARRARFRCRRRISRRCNRPTRWAPHTRQHLTR